MPLASFPIPYDTYVPGSAPVVETPIEPGAEHMFITVDTTDWHDPDAILDVAMEYSTDDGVTWNAGGRAPIQSQPDGTFRNPRGEVVTFAKAHFSWEQGVTHVRGTVYVLGATVTFGCTVDVQ